MPSNKERSGVQKDQVEAKSSIKSIRRSMEHWHEEFVRPVGYETYWVDEHFGGWLSKTYGSKKAFFDRVSAVVSTKETRNKAKTQPTGGRATVYSLKEPFIDPSSKLPCFEVDIKGIGLTRAGVLQYMTRFPLANTTEVHGWNVFQSREIVLSPEDDHEAWGPEGLNVAESEKYNINVVRRLGIYTPYPVAILKPKEFVIDGEIIPIKKLRELFNMPKDDELAFLIRAYPVSSTRDSDLIRSMNIFTDIKIGTSLERSEVESIRWLRSLWKLHERKRMVRNLKSIIDEPDFDAKLMKFNYEMTIKQLSMMIKLGLSPATGHESPNQHLHHTSLHNWTTTSALVEWSPITKIRDLNPKYRKDHYLALVSDAYEHLVAIGMVSLEDYRFIPDFTDFLIDLNSRIKNPDLLSATERYMVKLGGSVIYKPEIPLTLFVDWLRDNERKIVR